MKSIEKELEKITHAAGTLGFHVVLVPAQNPLATQRQLAVGLIGVLIKEYELENVVTIREVNRG